MIPKDSSKEEWRPVVIEEVYKDKYQVSNLGNVRYNPNYKWDIYKRKNHGNFPQRDSGRGYLQVQLYHTRAHNVNVHRLVMTSFVGPNKGLTINHKDEDKTNNRLDNLEYITNQANVIYSRGYFTINGKRYSTEQLINFLGVEGVTTQACSRRLRRLNWSLWDALRTPMRKPGLGRGQVSNG